MEQEEKENSFAGIQVLIIVIRIGYYRYSISVAASQADDETSELDATENDDEASEQQDANASTPTSLAMQSTASRRARPTNDTAAVARSPTIGAMVLIVVFGCCENRISFVLFCFPPN